MKIVPDQISPWLGGRLVTLGTDGFGRSDNREYLRRHFEVNAEAIVAATLSKLARDGKFNSKRLLRRWWIGINIDAKDPAIA
jgi:pyruvate dehydrogenase E1 component